MGEVIQNSHTGQDCRLLELGMELSEFQAMTLDTLLLPHILLLHHCSLEKVSHLGMSNQ